MNQYYLWVSHKLVAFFFRCSNNKFKKIAKYKLFVKFYDPLWHHESKSLRTPALASQITLRFFAKFLSPLQLRQPCSCETCCCCCLATTCARRTDAKLSVKIKACRRNAGWTLHFSFSAGGAPLLAVPRRNTCRLIYSLLKPFGCIAVWLTSGSRC